MPIEASDNQDLKGRKQYIRPEVRKVDIDNSISLIMMTPANPPMPPMPRAGTERQDSPFASPFDSPFD